MICCCHLEIPTHFFLKSHLFLFCTGLCRSWIQSHLDGIRIHCSVCVRLLQTSGFPGGSDGKESACSAGGPGYIPGMRERQPTSVFLPQEFHGQRSLVGYSPWGCKVSDMTEWLTFTVHLSFFLCNKGVILDERWHMKAVSTESGSQNTKDIWKEIQPGQLTLLLLWIQNIQKPP